MSNIRFSEKYSNKSDDNFFIKKTDIPPAHSGSLDELTFAVKDVIDIQNFKTSCGNPTWLAQQKPAIGSAPCIQELLANGARCLGKTILGEFCSGSTGVNHFYGMPPNPNAPTRVPGGSSSGSASVVASGMVDFSLGTDAAGSVRLPASFCGIYGMRPSYGSISMQGIKSFAPSFDTVGIFARDINVISKVFEVLVKKNSEPQITAINKVYIISDLMLLIPDAQRQVLESFIKDSCSALNLQPTYINLTDIHPEASHPEKGMSAIFRKVLCAEIWASLGEWIKQVDLKFQKDTYVDFSYMEQVAQSDLTQEINMQKVYANKLKDFISPGSILCIPISPDLPPLRNSNFTKVNEFNYEKLRPLICISSLGQLPQITMPIAKLEDAPLGASLLAGHNQDFALIEAVRDICDFRKIHVAGYVD